MIGIRFLLAAVALATLAYVWNASSRMPVVVSIEPEYDYIIGKSILGILTSFARLYIQIFFDPGNELRESRAVNNTTCHSLSIAYWQA